MFGGLFCRRTRGLPALQQEHKTVDAAQPEVSEERVRSLLWAMPNYHYIGDAVLTEQSEWLCEQLRVILNVHPEDAPEGPYAVSQQTDTLWIVRPKQLVDRTYVKWRFEGTEDECEVVRDALNRDVRDKALPITGEDE